ncbi:MAG: ATP-dependent protease ATPase subunit HslU [Leptospirales bacterium]|nr:ATP-dependent protease ATPase subunit HslU [Leptospirales bacterium]
MTTARDFDASASIRLVEEMSPRQIVAELDRYIVGQQAAKRAVALAVRNRVRRRLASEDLRDEIYPKNILMIGPTGCGKTEIARRLARLTGAPFLKVEATKYTEVGYVGRDVESMVRDLVASAVNLVRKEYRERVKEQAAAGARERLLDLLLPSSRSNEARPQGAAPDLLRTLSGLSQVGAQANAGLKADAPRDPAEEERRLQARDLMARKLDAGELEEREVELETQSAALPMVQVLSGGPNMEDLDMQVQNMLGDLLPRKSKRRRLSIHDARRVLIEEELDRLVDADKVQSEAIRRSEQMGVIFIDEMDKICGRSQMHAGADVSREGVQRDLLPIVEGATVNTRQGPIKTDHILFIAAGAFHSAKPSDLIPELQGRFPIRVELEKLSESDFRQILTGPRNSLTRQAQALLSVDGVVLDFCEDGLDEIAAFAFRVNETTENIGARRLHTIMERLLEEVSFDAPELNEDQKRVRIDRAFVQLRLKEVVENQDLSRYIL